jgi:hypothetical protein
MPSLFTFHWAGLSYQSKQINTVEGKIPDHSNPARRQGRAWQQIMSPSVIESE